MPLSGVAATCSIASRRTAATPRALSWKPKLLEDLVADQVNEAQGDYSGISAYTFPPRQARETRSPNGYHGMPWQPRHLYGTEATANQALARMGQIEKVAHTEI